MARYIDADKLLNNLPNDLPYKSSVKRVLIQAPAEDVVEVVRCEKCKHGEVSIISRTIDGKERKACYCNLKNGVTSLDYYCANGERGDTDA